MFLLGRLIAESRTVVVVSDEKMRRNGVERAFSKKMTNDGNDLSKHTENRQAESQTCNHMWRPQREKVRACAYDEVLSVQRMLLLCVSLTRTG